MNTISVTRVTQDHSYCIIKYALHQYHIFTSASPYRSVNSKKVRNRTHGRDQIWIDFKLPASRSRQNSVVNWTKTNEQNRQQCIFSSNCCPEGFSLRQPIWKLESGLWMGEGRHFHDSLLFGDLYVLDEFSVNLINWQKIDSAVTWSVGLYLDLELYCHFSST